MKPPKHSTSTITETFRMLDQMKAEGVSQADRDPFLEGVVRQLWPSRGTPYFVCTACEDTGWLPHVCTQTTPCGRPFRRPGRTNRSGMKDYTGQGMCTPGHEYITPCFCALGQAKRHDLDGTSGPEETVEGAGSARPKARQFTRIGR